MDRAGYKLHAFRHVSPATLETATNCIEGLATVVISEPLYSRDITLHVAHNRQLVLTTKYRTELQWEVVSDLLSQINEWSKGISKQMWLNNVINIVNVSNTPFLCLRMRRHSQIVNGGQWCYVRSSLKFVFILVAFCSEKKNKERK